MCFFIKLESSRKMGAEISEEIHEVDSEIDSM